MSTETFHALCDIIAADHGIARDALQPDTRLDALKIDSLALIELIFSLEEKYGVVAESVPDDLPTLGSVADYIDRLVQAKTGGDATPAGASTP